MNIAICLLPVVPMRKEPAHQSEMVSQLLFGEFAEILETGEYFSRIKSLYDNYEGWVQSNQLDAVENHLPPGDTSLYTCVYVADVLVQGKLVKAPFGSPVYQWEHDSVKKAGPSLNYLVEDGQVWYSETANLDKESVFNAYRHYINTPYLWGGRSVFGIDCSGLVQQLMKMFGIRLMRDASQQQTQGVTVGSLEESRLGDLAFFTNEKGKIHHVGLLLDDGKILHASGRVRIDTINNEGIFISDSGKQTHVLHSIKRVSEKA